MAQTPKKSQQPAPPAPITRRAHSRRQRELQRQRLVLIIAGSAIGLAVLAILVGVAYDRVWIPSRPIAQAGTASLSRGDYWRERRDEIGRQMAQNMQLLALFGGQFGSQFEGQIPQLDAQAATVRSAPVDEQTVSSWIDRQVILQSGAQQFNVQVSDGEIAQALVGDLGHVFPAPAAAPTSTMTLTPTAGISNTTAVASAATSAPTAAGTAATAAANATAVASPTLEPTPPPTATPLADDALKLQNDVISRLYDSYQQEIFKLSPDTKAQLAIEDFKSALHDQYLQQAATSKIEAQLVPEASFTPSTDPSGLETRQILLSVTATLSDTQQQRDAAFAASKPVAEAILKQLQGGADFATIAKERSDDYATRAEGGSLPSFDKTGKTQNGQQIDPEILKAALALKENEISGLIQTPFGWHIIQLIKRTVDSKETQLQAERSKKFDEWLKEKRAATDVQHFPAVTPSPTVPPTETPAALPTVQLFATPTATTVPTSTATLSNTTALPATALPTATAASTAATTAVPAVTSAPVTALPPIGSAAPTAVLPTPTATPKP